MLTPEQRKIVVRIDRDREATLGEIVDEEKDHLIKKILTCFILGIFILQVAFILLKDPPIVCEPVKETRPNINQ